MSTILSVRNGTVHRLLCTLRQTLVQSNASPVATTATTTTTSIVTRHFSRTNNCLGTFYEALNVPSNASQNDIKNAYYKLSMLYHPDRNRGSDRAMEKFREVSDAYEVLCNARTRQAYDAGLQRATTNEYRPTKEDLEAEVPPEVDDAQTRFYKQHMRRSQRPGTFVKYYDMDEWSREHYTRAFNKQRDQKRAHETRKASSLDEVRSEAASMMVLFFLAIAAMICFCFIYIFPKNDATNHKKTPTNRKS